MPTAHKDTRKQRWRKEKSEDRREFENKKNLLQIKNMSMEIGRKYTKGWKTQRRDRDRVRSSSGWRKTKTNGRKRGLSKKRGRKRHQARQCESKASNKFGHWEEVELFEIDNAARYQWGRGEAERTDVSFSVIQSKVVLCACKHMHMYTKFTQRTGQDHSFTLHHYIYTQSVYKVKCNERKSSHVSHEIKDPST